MQDATAASCLLHRDIILVFFFSVSVYDHESLSDVTECVINKVLHFDFRGWNMKNL